MLDLLQTIGAFLVAISVLVTIHEFGHFYVARLCGVHVIRFSVGFGWPLLRWTSKEQTEFVIAAIPLGGYVKMLDERELQVPDDLKHLAFNHQPVWQRMAVVLAGPLANFLLAIAIYWVIFTMGVVGLAPAIGKVDPGSAAEAAGLEAGQWIVAVDGRPTQDWTEVNLGLVNRLGDTGVINIEAQWPGTEARSRHQLAVTGWLADQEEPLLAESLGIRPRLPKVPAIVGSLATGGRAEAAGLQPGDEVRRVNSAPVDDWNQLVELIQASAETPMQLEVLRDGSYAQLTLTPEARRLQEGLEIGYAGIGAQRYELPEEQLVRVRHPFYLAWIPAAQRTWELSVFTLDAIGKIVMGLISPANLSGPFTIAKYAGDTARGGLESFLTFLAILSISLGVINLLPIPVLDGGHLLYHLVEAVARRPLPERVQLWGNMAGLVVIMGIMALAIYFDVIRLIG